MSTTVPELVRALDRGGRDVDVEAEVMAPAAITRAVVGGTADFGVLVTSAGQPGLRMRLLRRVAPVAVFHPSHELARRRRVEPAELARHRLALWPEDQAPVSHWLVRSMFERSPLEEGIAVVPRFLEDWLPELERGSFSVLPADMRLPDEIVAVAIADTPMSFETWLVWSDEAPSPFLDAMLAAASRLES